jgi:hypothetical protein
VLLDSAKGVRHVLVLLSSVLQKLRCGAFHLNFLSFFYLVNSSLKFVLRLSDVIGTIVTTADGSLLNLSLAVFKDPGFSRTLRAEEVFASVTEVTDVNEIENNMVTFSSLASHSAQGFLHESSSAGVSGQIEGSM